MSTHVTRCAAVEPLLADVVLGHGTARAREAVAEHCDDCANCAAALDQADAMRALFAAPTVAQPSTEVRERVVARVRRDLATAEPLRVAATLFGGAVAAVLALVLVNARTPLAPGIPLVVCGAAWTAAIGLAIYLGVSRRDAPCWPVSALAGVGALVAMSALCPPPALVETGRAAGWLSSAGLGSEFVVGLGFGAVPILFALLLSPHARGRVEATAGVGGLLLAAELPLLFALSCDADAIGVWPLIGGAVAGAMLVSLAILGICRERGAYMRGRYV